MGQNTTKAHSCRTVAKPLSTFDVYYATHGTWSTFDAIAISQQTSIAIAFEGL